MEAPSRGSPATAVNDGSDRGVFALSISACGRIHHGRVPSRPWAVLPRLGPRSFADFSTPVASSASGFTLIFFWIFSSRGVKGIVYFHGEQPPVLHIHLIVSSTYFVAVIAGSSYKFSNKSDNETPSQITPETASTARASRFFRKFFRHLKLLSPFRCNYLVLPFVCYLKHDLGVFDVFFSLGSDIFRPGILPWPFNNNGEGVIFSADSDSVMACFSVFLSPPSKGNLFYLLRIIMMKTDRKFEIGERQWACVIIV